MKTCGDCKYCDKVCHSDDYECTADDFYFFKVDPKDSIMLHGDDDEPCEHFISATAEKDFWMARIKEALAAPVFKHPRLD